MEFKESSYYKDFESLLTQINREFKKMQQKVISLQKENSVLRSELDHLKKAKNTGFDDLSESEKLALRHQIIGLISKIDNYLDDSNV